MEKFPKKINFFFGFFKIFLEKFEDRTLHGPFDVDVLDHTVLGKCIPQHGFRDSVLQIAHEKRPRGLIVLLGQQNRAALSLTTAAVSAAAVLLATAVIVAPAVITVSAATAVVVERPSLICKREKKTFTIELLKNIAWKNSIQFNQSIEHMYVERH